jgi:phosphate transport system permease protein
MAAPLRLQPRRAATATPAGGATTTTVPLPRRRPTEFDRVDYATMAGCAVSAVALSWVVFTRLTEGVGWFGFLLVVYFCFLALYGLVSADRLGRLLAVDRLATVAITSGAVLLAAPLLWLVGYVVLKGLPSLSTDFFREDQGGITPSMPASAGGGSHAIIGSIEQVTLALGISLPLALATAVFLNETRSRLRRPVRIFVDAMSGLPSVVAGLFIFAVLILPYAEDTSVFGNNGFMASLALGMIMLPTITRTVEVVLRLVPDGLREASLALGASRARTVWSVVLPTARNGITTAVVLGIARAVGETAPLLFTSVGASLFNSNPFNGPQESLPIFVYRNIRNTPLPTQIDRGFTGAFVLMLIVLTLFAITRFVGGERRSGRRTRRRVDPVAPSVATTQETE